MTSGVGTLTLDLRGLEASNPLALLAAVGTLRTLSEAWPEQNVRLAWILHGSQWRPSLHTELPSSQGKVAEALHNLLSSGYDIPDKLRSDSLGKEWNNLKATPGQFASEATEVAEASSHNDRSHVDFLAAIGSDSFPEGASMEATRFRLISGQGHQNFIPAVRNLVEWTEPSHITEALFQKWQYDDDGKNANMRWDPNDDRRHALKAKNPTSEAITTVRGANRLAIAGLRCFPTAPQQSERLATTGFTRKRGERATFSWPIWEPPITLETMMSLLSHPEVSSEKPNRAILEPIGVVEVYRSKLVSVGQFQNFTRGRPYLT